MKVTALPRILVGVLVVGSLVILAPPASPQSSGTGFSVLFQERVQGDAAVAGVALRNLGTGTIDLLGIPPSASIVRAWLYWEIIDHKPELIPGTIDIAIVNGVPVKGDLIGLDRDPCWHGGYTFAFRADITPLVTGSGPYLVTVASADTGGQDPFIFGSNYPAAEGASIVAVWVGPSPAREITIVDGLDVLVGSSTTVTVPNLSPSPHAGVLTLIGGDGQFNTLDTVSWNGGPAIHNLYDGSDQQAIPDYIFQNLWDTDQLAVATAAGPTNALTISSITDCIAPEAFVLSVG